MLNFSIVDTHVHFWDPARLRYRWLDGIDQLNRTYVPKDYDAACGGFHVEKLVFVQCDCLPEQQLAEVEWVEELAVADPRISGIVAFAAVEDGHDVRKALERLVEHKMVKGVRRLLQSETDDEFCLQPAFLQGVAELAAFNLRFDICIKHPQLKAATEMVRRTPHVQFVLDHIGKPDIKSQDFDPWRAEIEGLSQLPNVSCKLSGLVTEADVRAWQPADLRPYIDHVLDSFGTKRVMFGSDWPVVSLAGGYERWISTLVQAVDSLPEVDRKRLFRDNAISIYQLE